MLRILISCTLNKMLFIEDKKKCGEIVKIYYLNGQNAAGALCVYRTSLSLLRGSCIVRAVQDMIREFEKTDSACDRSRLSQTYCCRNLWDDKRSSSCMCTRCSPHSAATKFCGLRSVLVSVCFRIRTIVPRCCKRMIRYDEDSSWPSRILWTDEAHFSLTEDLH